ncbi:MAG: FecR domain-containing protein [Planctomycetota bacterium]|nr:FecR domain-containing protein [Planctomycetota bacterium]
METAPIPEIELHRYLDGRLSREEQAAFDERLKNNPASRRTLDAMREEARLLREGLENLSEPPYKIGDKVLAGIYEEYRKRTAAQRARRLRNRFLVTLSAAAMLLAAVYFVQPRDPAGALASGNRASVVQSDGKLEVLTKGGKIYEGDVLATGRGEFVRLRLADGSLIDVDEDSRVRVEQVRNRTTTLALESGRLGVEVGPDNLGFSLKLASGHIQADPGALLDIWLPAPSPARMPQGMDAWTAPEAARKHEPAPGVACLSMREGTAYVITPEFPRGLTVEHLRRVSFGPGQPLNGGAMLGAPQALDSRNEAWAVSETGPQDRAVVGLFAPFDFSDLGRRFGLTEQLPGGETAVKAMQAALAQLTDANNLTEPEARATRLSEGQQGLREVAQGFPLIYEGRRRARVLEGLAHYERGRALMALRTTQGRSGAEAAFLASAVAFHEALGGDEVQGRAPGLAELKLAPKVAASSRLRDFSADEGALLLAQFYRPWALCHLRTLNALNLDSAVREKDLPALFESTCEAMGRSVEGLAARYGKARALVLDRRENEALATLEELCLSSVAGAGDEARAMTEGLRQAAHVERARLYAAAGDGDGLNTVSEEFRMRYPLEGDGAAGREIRAIQNGYMLQSGAQALNERRFEDAARMYVAIFSRPGVVEAMAPADKFRLKASYLEALVGKEDGRGAFRMLKELEKLKAPEMPPVERLRIELLKEKAAGLYEFQKKEAKAAPAAPPAEKSTIELDLEH